MSIIAATAFHFRVRNENGCFHSAKSPEQNSQYLFKNWKVEVKNKVRTEVVFDPMVGKEFLRARCWCASNDFWTTQRTPFTDTHSCHTRNPSPNRKWLESLVGFEPTTFAFFWKEGDALTKLSYNGTKKLAGVMGVEPNSATIGKRPLYRLSYTPTQFSTFQFSNIEK